MKKILPLVFISMFIQIGCQSNPELVKKDTASTEIKVQNVTPKKVKNSLAEQLQKPEVPILCYHRIRDILASDGENMKTYSVTPADFAKQMKALSDNGFHSILPNQLYDYLVYNAKLPSKPVMITFDDTREEQYRLAVPEMNKYGFKGVYFIMTISINRPKYMTKEQIKNLSDTGHSIGTHSWDHHMVTKYVGKDWETQLTKPKKKLEDITGKPVNYFAYPDGVWNHASIAEIKKSGYQLAFSLSTKRDATEPLFTVRRIIVAGNLSANGMLKSMQSSFNK
jgi:peptidoglycan/xylan/chitin deacetylase (PgdA/CDA1 family)